MEIPEYQYMMALLVRLFAWHLGQENKEGKHIRKKNPNMGTMHHPRGELQMFLSPAQRPPVY